MGKETEQKIDSFYEMQMLCAEWNPTISACLLGLFAKFTYFQQQKSSSFSIAGFSVQQISQVLSVVWVLMRLIFFCRIFFSPRLAMKIGFPTMTTSYVIGAILSCVLI